MGDNMLCGQEVVSGVMTVCSREMRSVDQDVV